ncbi:hypothetical protein TYRP_023153 [Tyrophagus putrescentiae]|nr:hypothetical protein TYRP_023153 [Tyrophagus putrescentiae]
MPESAFHEQLVEQGLGSGSEGRPVGNIFHKIACIFDGTSCLYTSERLPIISDKTIKFRVNSLEPKLRRQRALLFSQGKQWENAALLRPAKEATISVWLPKVP